MLENPPQLSKIHVPSGGMGGVKTCQLGCMFSIDLAMTKPTQAPACSSIHV